ncbi:MAG: hypothetical protein K0S33_1617 [Bacteroidetes bacterium]|jgi:hypothetical protein|nr:hypothetical protein [Bacteroidota bacterium]
MNKELYDGFKKLSDTAKNELKFKLKDSPLARKLYEFLESTDNRNFKNREVVAKLYGSEMNTSEYAVLENRYFKLRKKFTEEWLQPIGVSAMLLAEEEMDLLKCKQLIMENQKEQAYQKLLLLEKTCWEKNIFELLPAIIDNLIFCNQTLNRLERNDALYDRQYKAIVLQADCYKMVTLAREVYEINFKRGVVYAKKQLAEIKELGLKHKSYPRFIMCYHHVSLYYKLGSHDYLEDMQVVSRHYKQCRELNSKYPYMPLVSYRLNYSVYQHMHYKQIQVFYHYNRMEFEDAYLAMKDIWDLVHSENEAYALFKTESIYHNMFSSQRTTNRHVDAEKTIGHFITFLKDNNSSMRLNYAYTLQAMLVAYTFTKNKQKDIPYLLEKTDEYIKGIRGNANVQTTAGEALLTKAKLNYLCGNIAEAIKTLKEKEVVEYLNRYTLTPLFTFVINKQMDLLKLKDFKKGLYKRIATCKIPTEHIELKWLQKVLG